MKDIIVIVGPTGVGKTKLSIELAKIYSDDDVRKMINGVLDKIYHDVEKC